MTFLGILQRRWRPTVSLALPVMMGQVGMMLMVLVDTVMVGKLGPEALGGVGLASAIFWSFSCFAMGLMWGLDALVSHDYGAKDLPSCHRWLVQALYLATLIAPPLMLGVWAVGECLPLMGVDPVLIPFAKSYLNILNLSLPAFLWFVGFRQYLQSMDEVLFAGALLIGANLTNALLNWILIFGKLGMPALGVAGAAWATSISRVFMLAALIAFTFYRDRRLGLGLGAVSKRLDSVRLKRLFRLGLPAGFQLFFEVTAFSISTTLVGRLGAVPLAAHTIALNVASFTFMVPFGLASAAAVLVGQALGRQDPIAARESGWCAIALGGGFMLLSGLTLFFGAESILGIFTQDPATIQIGIPIFTLAAIFQIADGVQTVATGALRGAKDTRSGMLATLAGHWMAALPSGYLFAFVFSKGVIGIWTGFCVGLWSVATLLLARWRAVALRL